MTTPPPEPTPGGGLEASAFGHSQQAVQGQGVQHITFSMPGGMARPDTARDTLVPPPSTLTGRDREIEQLLQECKASHSDGRPAVLTVVHGMGGVGKTAVARVLAKQLADRFPDARFEVDLQGFTPGEEPRQPDVVLSELLSLAGYAAGDIPPHTAGKSALWRSWLTRRRVLLVLDNARSAGQVRPLLPGGGAGAGCLVVVTSRHRLEELDAAVRVGLDLLPTTDAVALLVRLTGRTADQLGSAEELVELARLCGRLPLALRPVGVQLTVLNAADLIPVMRAAERPLRHLPEADRAATAAFTVSYDALDGGLQSTLRACAWHPGPDFDAASIAALSDQSPPVAAVQLADLLRRNMLIGLPHRRYTFHDLFAGYTRLRAEQHPDSAEATIPSRHRLYGHLKGAVIAATEALLTHRPITNGDIRNSRASAQMAYRRHR